MTLHEAMEHVLKEEGRPMTRQELADAINEQDLYQRGDGYLVPSNQIGARAKNYPYLFVKVGNKIDLV